MVLLLPYPKLPPPTYPTILPLTYAMLLPDIAALIQGPPNTLLTLLLARSSLPPPPFTPPPPQPEVLPSQLSYHPMQYPVLTVRMMLPACGPFRPLLFPFRPPLAPLRQHALCPTLPCGPLPPMDPLPPHSRHVRAPLLSLPGELRPLLRGRIKRDLRTVCTRTMVACI